MAKKRKKQAHSESRSTADYYKLKTRAVDDLVNADAANSPPVPEAELRKYRARRTGGIPDWLKVNFIKFWFPAAVCYFFLWGLGMYVPSLLDLLFITGIALGIVTDILTNNALRFFAETEGANDRWMMFPKKRYITFFLNIFYAFVLLALVYFLYVGINMTCARITGDWETVFLGVEPILFGLFYVLFDTLLVGVKNFCARRIRGRKDKNV